MKTKFVKVTDTGTEMYFLLIQFQESESDFLSKAGTSSSTKIALNLSDRPITCMSGYEFNTRYGNTIPHLSKVMDENGTTNGLKEVLHNTSDISHLPDELNVEAARWAYIHSKSEEDDELEEILENAYDDENYRKCLSKAIFKGYSNIYTFVVFDNHASSIIYEKTLIHGNQDDFFCTYLWMPIEESPATPLLENYVAENFLSRVTI